MTAAIESKTKEPTFDFREVISTAVLGVPLLVLLVVAGITLVVGFPYYSTPMELRAEHELRPYFDGGGRVGLWLGLVGSGLMLMLLVYSLRKWVPSLKFLGEMQFWMSIHVMAGLLGPSFIVLHGAFNPFPHGSIGIGFWCMVFVAFSGFFGRYLFGFFPSTAHGLQVDLRAAKKQLTDLRAELVAQTRDVSHDGIGKAVRLVKNFDYEPRSIGGLVILDAEVRRRTDLVRIMLHRADMADEVRGRAEQALTAQLNLNRSVAGWIVARRLLRYWNLFHQPLAIAMY